jgi:hypothetical protein
MKYLRTVIQPIVSLEFHGRQAVGLSVREDASADLPQTLAVAGAAGREQRYWPTEAPGDRRAHSLPDKGYEGAEE